MCMARSRKSTYFTAQKMKFSVKEFFSKCFQIRISGGFGHIC